MNSFINHHIYIGRKKQFKTDLKPNFVFIFLIECQFGDTQAKGSRRQAIMLIITCELEDIVTRYKP